MDLASIQEGLDINELVSIACQEVSPTTGHTCRLYISHLPCPNLDSGVFELLVRLLRFQRRAFRETPMKARKTRRILIGTNEVFRNLGLENRVKLLIVARDVQDNVLVEPKWMEILHAAPPSIPIIYAFTRRQLGLILSGKLECYAQLKNVSKTQISICAIINQDGAHDLMHQLVDKAHELTIRWNSALDFLIRDQTCLQARNMELGYLAWSLGKFGKLDPLRRLLELHPQIIAYIHPHTGDSILSILIGRLHEPLVVWFIETYSSRLDMTLVNFSLQSIVHIAAAQTTKGIFTLVLQSIRGQCSAVFTRPDAHDTTPLGYLIIRGFDQSVKALLDAKLVATDITNEVILACSRNSIHSLELFVQANYTIVVWSSIKNTSSIIASVKANALECLKILLAQNESEVKSIIDRSDDNGCTALWWATFLGFKRAEALLLSWQESTKPMP